VVHDESGRLDEVWDLSGAQDGGSPMVVGNKKFGVSQSSAVRLKIKIASPVRQQGRQKLGFRAVYDLE
jgi:hypothetical protein